jgi:ABC-type transport system involved in multi-copper enzyme maturation permease subunit
VTAVALFCSTFSSSALLSAGLTAGLFVAGQFGADLKNLDQVVESPTAAAIGRALYYVLPNFAAFDIKAQVVHGALLLVAAVLVFSRRDLK